MAITPDQYHLLIAAPMLQDYLVDKDTGFPLAGGWITFFHDTDRQRLKNVYTQTGTPGSYNYVPIANPMQLSSVGTMTDSFGNDIIPFYFPFDEEDSNEIDTYYVVVQANTPNNIPGVEQFTRENFPFVDSEDNPDFDQLDLINLIPNGQFTAHNNIPNDGTFPNGDSSFTVAQGGAVGWYYTKNNTSTDSDIIIFDQLTQEPPNITGNPRFAIDITCEGTSGNDTFKELRMRFNNVNRFASETNIYTFSFTGKSNSASTTNIFLNTIKNFGTGGSATLTTTLEGFTLESGIYDIFSFSFIFGTNEGSTIGPDNDDYIEISLAFPSTQTFSISLTDFILVAGDIDISQYPERPDNMVFADAIAGSVPTPDFNRLDIGLPLILTPGGATYDHSIVGQITAFPANSNDYWLLCDGTTYSNSDFSDLGIPYARLGAKLFAAGTDNVPLFSTGGTFATARLVDTTTNTIRLTTGQAGAQTGAADAIPPHATGFSFSNIHTGQASVILGESRSSTLVQALGSVTGNVTAATNGTTSFTVLNISSLAGSTIPQYFYFFVEPVAGASISGSEYFTWHANPGNAAFYMWFTVDGVGADPTPGGTGFRVNLLSTYTAIEVTSIVREAISGYQMSGIVLNAAATLSAGDYWTFNANSETYNVVYKIGGSVTLPGTGTNIIVTLTGSETAADVTTATIIAINTTKFAVPNLQGQMLIGKAAGFDTNATTRWSGISNYFGANLGTTSQWITYYLDTSTLSVVPTGSEVLNTSINWYIRY